MLTNIKLPVTGTLLLLSLFFGIAASQASENKTKPPKKKYVNLDPEGDYSRLTYKIFANKKTYKRGEPVFIGTMVINDSDGPVAICTPFCYDFLGVNIIRVLDKRLEKMPWTLYGKYRNDLFGNDGDGSMRMGGPVFEKLEPGEKRRLDGIQLNAHVDMTTPGKYHITFYRTVFMIGQRYEEPLPSNRVTIIVENERFGSHDLKEPGTYDNDTGDSMEEMLKVKEKWMRPRKPDKEQSDPNTEEKEKSKPAETSPTEPEAKPDNPQE